MSNQARLVVLISGNGSNLQAIIDACEANSIPAKIVGVLSNKPNAYGLIRAEQHQIPTLVYEPQKGETRANYDTTLSSLVATFTPDWVILAGWMRILTLNFLQHFPNQVINLHPALPGQFAGIQAIERAYHAYQQGHLTETGVMVHLVPDEGVDDGPVLASEVVPIKADDTLETLETRIHTVEHRLLVDTIDKLVNGDIAVPN